MKVAVAAGVDQAIAQMAAESADGLETGGILLGHDRGGDLLVTTAGDPGPAAQRAPTSFLRDLAHAQRLGDEAYEADGSVWIGEWHTHPGGMQLPSPTDLTTYSALLADERLALTRFLSLIVVPCPQHGWAEVFVHAWVFDGRSAVHVPLIPFDEA
jgi:integrative and conjugative element protein (TIGR02256 family)